MLRQRLICANAALIMFLTVHCLAPLEPYNESPLTIWAFKAMGFPVPSDQWETIIETGEPVEVDE